MNEREPEREQYDPERARAELAALADDKAFAPSIVLVVALTLNALVFHLPLWSELLIGTALLALIVAKLLGKLESDSDDDERDLGLW